MIRVRGLPFRDEDDAVDYFRQRELDAFIEGRQAGMLGLAAGLNPHLPGSREGLEWERGRSAVEALRAAEALAQRARRSCDPCHCGGRGLCRDAA